MHNQLTANWTADWGALPETIITVIEANQEGLDLDHAKTVELWANLFQEAGLNVQVIQGIYDSAKTVNREQWRRDRFNYLQEQEKRSDTEMIYWLEVDGYLIDPNSSRSLAGYYPYWVWPEPIFDDLMWQEDWQPLEADADL